MKSARFLFGLVLIVPAFIAAPAFADSMIHIAVPASCTVTDSTNATYQYAQSGLGICALEAAKEANLLDFTATFYDTIGGLFIDSINAISPGSNEFWSISQNGISAQVGISELPVAAGDTLSFILTNWMTNTTSTTFSLHIDSVAGAAASAPNNNGMGGGEARPHYKINVTSALLYLAAQQKSDGSFDSPMLSDWTAIALASVGNGTMKTALRNYEQTATPPLATVTDHERHAMALEALGIDPRNGTHEDEIAPIVAAFDGTQIGDPHLDNDDIFALIPLLHAGYRSSDGIIATTTAFILTAQQRDGSWDESADMTAAAIQALAPLHALPNVPDALAKARDYLHSHQLGNGGWGNSFSTSWALQAIAALGESPDDWAPLGDNPNDNLAYLQQADGGVELASENADTRAWATAYAIPASLGKTWNDLLQSFTATSTPAISATAATSTRPIATAPTATSTAISDATSTTPSFAIATTSIASSTASTTLAIRPTHKHAAAQAAAIPVPMPTPASQIVGASAAVPANFFDTINNAVYSITMFLGHL